MSLLDYTSDISFIALFMTKKSKKAGPYHRRPERHGSAQTDGAVADRPVRHTPRGPNAPLN